MVCPMRFVLLGASAIVALVAVVYTRQCSEQAKIGLPDREEKVCASYLSSVLYSICRLKRLSGLSSQLSSRSEGCILPLASLPKY